MVADRSRTSLNFTHSNLSYKDNTNIQNSDYTNNAMPFGQTQSLVNMNTMRLKQNQFRLNLLHNKVEDLQT